MFGIKARIVNVCDTPPNSLIDSTTSLKVKTTEGKELSTLPGSHHFEGRGACRSSKMGIKDSDKWVNYSHSLPQTKKKLVNA
jgi:hypothetical protein